MKQHEKGTSKGTPPKRRKKTGASPTAASRPTGVSSRVWEEKLVQHRRRQESVGTILDAAFGTLADCDPSLWEHRAYLMLVGMVYERLAADEQEISTQELVRLARALAEHRRLKKSPDDLTIPTESSGDSRKLASTLSEVYGTGNNAGTTSREPTGELNRKNEVDE